MGLQALRRFETLPALEKKSPLPAWRRWSVPECSFNYREYRPIDTVVIHATAGSSSAGAMSVSQQCTASWHWLIPDENEAAHGEYVWHCVDHRYKAWHVLRRVKFPLDGHTDINSRAIGIEIVNAQIGEGDLFSDWQLQVTAQIVNYCRSVVGPGRKWYLATHAYLDPNRKLDPGHVFDWDKFMRYIGVTNGVESLKIVCEWPGGVYTAIPCDAQLVDGRTMVDAALLQAGVGLPVTMNGQHHIRVVLPPNWIINGSHIKNQGKVYVFAPS